MTTQERPDTDELPPYWERKGDCVVHECGFRFGAEHAVMDDGSYSCPICEPDNEIEALKAKVASHKAEIDLLDVIVEERSRQFVSLSASPPSAGAIGEVLKAARVALAKAKTLRKANKLVGPADYQGDHNAMRIWQRTSYHNGKDICEILQGPLSALDNPQEKGDG